MVQRATFTSAAKTIFDAFGDLIENVSYRNAGVWNPITETEAPTTTETVRVAVREFTRAEQISVRGAVGKLAIMSGDLQALIIVSEITITPKIDDILTLDTIDYLVRSVGDISKVLWRLQLRRV